MPILNIVLRDRFCWHSKDSRSFLAAMCLEQSYTDDKIGPRTGGKLSQGTTLYPRLSPVN